ncbi:MAG: peptidyl-alpha-hydroxyglycine alpha-amidating lyase family protein [Pseudomonadota bacterium]
MRFAAFALATTLGILTATAESTNGVGLIPDSTTPSNEVLHPYHAVRDNFKMPTGRSWGSTSAVDIDRDGKSIWVAERCGKNNCFDRRTGAMSDLPTVLKFDENGRLMKAFGAGLLVFPHGIHVDRDGNVWVTDGQDNGERQEISTAGPIGPRNASKGNQVFKFSPDGEVLLVLGKPGGAVAPDYFYQPSDVVTAPNGDIFVADGHDFGNNRIVKFDRSGKFVKEWGRRGTAPGEFDQPHGLAIDSHNRLLVGDRNNNRVQIFDLDGNFIQQLHQFSRPSGIWVTKDDVLYVTDSESESATRSHDGWKRGIRWGSLKDGKITGFIPDPVEHATGTSAAEGVAVDADGNIYGAEVGPKELVKYTMD